MVPATGNAIVYNCIILCIVITLSGCYSSGIVTKEEFSQIDSTAQVTLVVRSDGSQISFDGFRAKPAHIRDTVLAGVDVTGNRREISLSDIDHLETRTLSPVRTFAIPVAIVGGTFLTLWIVAQSDEGNVHPAQY